MISPAKTAKEKTLLQADLDKLPDWAKIWRLVQHYEMQDNSFGRKNLKSQYYMCGIDSVGQMIGSSHAERDLGIVLDDELKFEQHAWSVASKSLQTLGIVKRKFCIRSPKLTSKLNKEIVLPKQEFDMCMATLLNKGNKSVRRQAIKSKEGCKSLDYPSHMDKLQIPILSYQWKHKDVIMAYQMLHTQSFQQNMLQLDQPTSIIGHTMKLYCKHVNTRLENSFFPNRVMGL
ncbi:uncharacterized protein LOC136042543 [Artemia franciscana]|uniref:uncharacterized protein LOC136042543 n=1 Tax=Artemia franciscana TaxID=6661 RepID=UPI0032DADF56